ncbi:MAG: TetR/AcrR family transcriptional regulator [Polyangiaceae bacterium]
MPKPARKKAPVPKKAARTRGRPREFVREVALGQAMRLFWFKGFEATSISDLVEAMGIASPSLYAAFGSKEALYAESIRHYGATHEPLFWSNFHAAATARDAVQALLNDTAATLAAQRGKASHGCMVALSSVGGQGHEQLGELVRLAREKGLLRVKKRLAQAVTEGEIPAGVDCHALARFVQTVQVGMSIVARDGASRAELEEVARGAMDGWDARVSRALGV